MTELATTNPRENTSKALILMNNKPGIPVNQKQPAFEKRIADPSSTLPNGKSYPIPSFFEYRVKPKEFDSL